MEKTPLRLPADFVDLLTEFERSGVRHVVLGGYAVGFMTGRGLRRISIC